MNFKAVRGTSHSRTVQLSAYAVRTMDVASMTVTSKDVIGAAEQCRDLSRQG